MKCEQATKQLRKDFINKVHRHATDPYYAHLLGCPPCRQQQEYLQQMYTVFQDVPKTRLPDTLIVELQEYCSNNVSSKKEKKKRRIGFLFWYAVATTCLVVVALYLYKSGNMTKVQKKFAEFSAEVSSRMSDLMERVSEKGSDVSQIVMQQIDITKDKLTGQQEEQQNGSHQEGNFAKISKNLNQPVNAKINDKSIQDGKKIHGLKQDNSLYGKNPGENVVDTEPLENLTLSEEMDQLFEQQKQSRKLLHDKLTDTSDDEIEAQDQDLHEEENSEMEVGLDENPDAETKLLSDQGGENQPGEENLVNAVVLQNQLKDKKPLPEEELSPCAFSNEFSGYSDVDFDKNRNDSSVAVDTFSNEVPEGDFILASARRFYSLNWGKEEKGVMGDVVLAPTLGSDTTNAIDVVGQPHETGLVSDSQSQFSAGADSDVGQIKLTLGRPADAEDLKLHQIISELEAEEISNLGTDGRFSGNGTSSEPPINLDEIEQVLDKYHLQYCAEDPSVLNRRQFSILE